jgi:signal transduction histidine kinase/ActR/RegA family two-component response regulator
MSRRTAAIGVRLPLLMTGIVLVASMVFVWLAYNEYEDVLVASTAARMEANATLVQGLLTGTGTAGAALANAAKSPAIRRSLTGAEPVARTSAVLQSMIAQTQDSTRVRVRVISLLGEEIAEYRMRADLAAPTWIGERAARGLLPRATVIISPILAGDTLAYYELGVPVHARDDGESLVGYLVETRLVRGRNVEAVRNLVGTEVLLIGQPGAGVWTDLERVTEPPPAIERLDTAFVFEESPRGPGIGVAKVIPNSPWQMWVQISADTMLAPARTFVWRMLPVGITITLLAVMAAWLFSRSLTRRLLELVERVDSLGGHRDKTLINGTAAQTDRDEVDRLTDAFEAMSQRASKQQALERQLMQSQKLEAVGTLAGGIAHDFNNMLTVVMNYAEMVGADLPPDSPAARDIKEVLHASEGAANLTRQLLAFSRRQILQAVPTALNEVIRGAHRMLSRVIPSNVEFHLELDDKIGAINGDQSQLEQVLMNLTLNAADAMPQGGRLTFRTTLAELDESHDAGTTTAEWSMQVSNVKPHVCLIVADTGVGMDKATVQRVFEPFFTTKVAKGTGLGLASVHGIVTQLGGRIWVYSELGHGTTFKIYFPELDAAAIPLPARPAIPMPGTVSGTILLVEDDAGTREVTRRILTRHGYSVVIAHHGGEALALMTRGLKDVRLVISDVMMPTMDGVELANRLAQRWPELPVLLMSGYSDADVRARADQVRKVTMLEKPFTSATLLEAATLAIRSAAK